MSDDATFLDAAASLAWRSTCDRARVGCVIVVAGRIVACGYNDTLLDLPNCAAAGHLMVGGHCWRTTHAEQMALAAAARFGVSVAGGVLYATSKPCSHCTKLLHAARIARIVYRHEYTDEANALLLAASGMELVKLTG